MPSLVPPATLPAANARIELARTVAFAAGPAVGGALVGWIGGAPAFGFAAALSIVAVVMLARIDEPARAAAPRRHPLREIREGASFVFRHDLLRPVFVTQFIFNTASFLILAVFVPYAVRALGLSASGVGLTLAMYGAGMVVGALLATRVLRRLQFGTVIALGPVTGFVAAVVMALTTFMPTPILAGLSFFLLGAGPILWVISTTTLRQSVTPPHLLGRVSAINIMAYGARPLGAALGALVGEQLRRRGVPLSRGRGIWRAGAGHSRVAGRQVDPPAGDVRGTAGRCGCEVLNRFARSGSGFAMWEFCLYIDRNIGQRSGTCLKGQRRPYRPPGGSERPRRPGLGVSRSRASWTSAGP